MSEQDPHALASVRQERDEYLAELVELREENATLRARLAKAEAELDAARAEEIARVVWPVRALTPIPTPGPNSNDRTTP